MAVQIRTYTNAIAWPCTSKFVNLGAALEK